MVKVWRYSGRVRVRLGLEIYPGQIFEGGKCPTFQSTAGHDTAAEQLLMSCSRHFPSVTKRHYLVTM